MSDIDDDASNLTSDSIPSDFVADEKGLLFACRLDGNGSATMMTWAEIQSWRPEEGPIWVHLDRKSPNVANWLSSHSGGLSQPTINALLAAETRPRVFHGNKGTVAILRGINLNDDADPEDMISLRLWCDGKRVISLRNRKVMSLRDVLAQLLDQANGPATAAELFERLISRLVLRMSETVSGYDDQLDDIETDMDIKQASSLRRALSEMRRETIMLRRHLSPQREALNHLLLDPPKWLDATSKMHFRETIDQLLRYLESLDTARERTMIIKDDIANTLSESTNRTLYVLSIISAIFLPLGFLTGLLGINVGGMPGMDNPYAFWISAVLMVGIVALEIIILKRLKWLG